MKILRICLICLPLLSFSSVFAQDSSQENEQTGVSGYVIEKLSGKPIQNAEVFYGTSRGDEHTATDSNGFFIITGIEQDYEKSITIVAKNFASRKTSFIPVPGKILEGIKIELMPSCKVAGFIKDENANPVAGAAVELFYLTSQTVKTDTNGFYEIDGLDPAFGQYQIKVMAGSYPAITTSFPPAGAGQTAKLDIALKPGVTVLGRVTNPDGNPLAGATIGNTESQYMWNSINAITDANGYYELKSVDKGPLVLWAIHPQYPPYVERFNISPQESEKQINIKFEKPNQLRGKVVDGRGNPVQDVKVNIRNVNGVEFSNNRPEWIITDVEGKFVIDNAPSSGKVTLQLWSQTVPNIMPEIEVGKDEHIIEVQRAGIIYGQVTDNASGKQVSKFNVKLGSSNKNKKFAGGYSATWSREGHNFDDSNGFFDTGKDTLPIGALYTITVYAKGYDLLTIDPVEVLPASDEPNRTVFKLTPPTAIAGKVVNENNEPVAEASVRWFSQSNRLQMSDGHWDDKDTVTTDSNGCFSFDTIGSGKRGIYIAAAGFAPYIDANLTLPDDKEELSEIVLEKGAEVYGTVYKNGKSDSGVKISCNLDNRYNLEQMGYIEKSTVTSIDGNYCLSDLPAGKLGIYTMSPTVNLVSYTMASKHVTLSPGQKLKLDFGNEQGFTVTGQVLIGKTPTSGTNVSFSGKDYSQSDTSDSNGFFRITGLAKGMYDVRASYRKPQASSVFSSRQYNLEDELRDNKQIDVNSDMTVNIEFGSSSVSGKIPSQFIGAENLRLMARRWNPKSTNAIGGQTLTMNWDYASSQTKIDPNGSFAFSNLKPGKYYLPLYNNNQCLAVSKIFEIDASHNINDIVFLPASSKLHAVVLDAQNKQPLADAGCGLFNDLELFFFSRHSDVNVMIINKTDANGQIDFDNLPAGTYTLTASKDGFVQAAKDNIHIDENSSASIEIALEKSAVVKFILDDAAKKLITKPLVYLTCSVTNIETGRPYTRPSMYGEIKKISVLLQAPQEYMRNAPPRPPLLNLPAGKFRLEYEVTQSDPKVSEEPKPLISGQTEVDIKAGQTTEVIIK